LPTSPKSSTRQLDWSAQSLADRKKIARFYAEEASFLVAIEADREIQQAAARVLRRPMGYREGKRTGTRECVIRRFPYILVYKVFEGRVFIVRVLHHSVRYFN